MHNDLFTLETDLAEVIRTLELEGDANDPLLIDSADEAPLAHVSLEQIQAGWGLDVQDRKRMTTLEREARARQMDTMRKRQKRAQAKRTARDKVRDAKPIDMVRMRVMLAILGNNLLDVVTDTVIARYNRFRRVMGDVQACDLANDAILTISESLARTEHDIVDIAEAALWLSHQPMPIDTAQDDAPKCARMLMGTIVRKAGHAIVDTYRKSTVTGWVQVIDQDGKDTYERKDMTMLSLDLLTTMVQATGSDVDTLLSKHNAGGKPKHESKPPNNQHARAFARMVIDNALSARGLDWLTDLILDSLRTDGAFTWTKHVDEVWDGLGMPEVVDLSPALKIAYTKRAVEMAYAFLPEVIATAYDIASQPEVLSQYTYLYDRNVVQHVATRMTGHEHPQVQAVQNVEKLLDSGARIFLEGQVDGEAPTQVREGPGADEWKRVFKVVDSTLDCIHGTRRQVFGMTKKPHAHPRRWSGHFCAAAKGTLEMCAPIFGSDKPIKTNAHYAMEAVESASLDLV